MVSNKYSPILYWFPAMILFSGSVSAVTLISRSDGLEDPIKESGHTELEIGDINGDGYLDIVSVGDHGSPWIYEHGIMVWLGDGSGTWSVLQSGEFGYGGCAIGDLNLDGYMDVAWGIHHNYGSGGFGDRLMGAALGDGDLGFTLNQSGISGTYMMSVDCGDFNGDGRDDIVCSFGSDSGVHCYYFDEGSSQWVDASIGLPSGSTNVDLVQFGYIDSDDDMDLVLYDDPVGQVYLGDGTGIWIPDATWTMPGSGEASALRINGDIDHDGREDIAIQGEMLVGGWEETLKGLSIREIKWLTAVPFEQGQATVDLYFSISGAGGPWNLIVSGVPDSGCYQWSIPQENSDTCRIRVVAGTATDTVEDISDDDFTINGTTGIENGRTSSLDPVELRVIPNPTSSIPVLNISPALAG